MSVGLWNSIITWKGKEIIDNWWKSAGIFAALELGLSKMLLINPFQGVDTMLSNDAEQYDDSCLLAICDFTAEEFEASYGSKIQESDDSTESKWEEAEN